MTCLNLSAILFCLFTKCAFVQSVRSQTGVSLCDSIINSFGLERLCKNSSNFLAGNITGYFDCPNVNLTGRAENSLKELLELNSENYSDLIFPSVIIRDFNHGTTVYELNILKFDLKFIPDTLKKLSEELVILTISHCEMKTITTELTDFFQLLELHLPFNRIQRIDQNAFQGMSALEKLFLQHNDLEMLHPDSLKPLENLNIINLSHNRMLTLDHLFSHVNPTSVYLSSNELKSIDNAFSEKMTRLESVVLNDNPLQTIGPPGFSRTNLTSIFLANAKLTYVYPHVFPNDSLLSLTLTGNNFPKPEFTLFLPNKVVILNLSGCKISTLRRVMQGRSLFEIFLDNNDITELGASDFKNVSSLIRLHLHHNAISNLHPDTFQNTSLILYLDLSYNLLRTLNGSLGDLCILKYLNLSHNQLTRVQYSDLKCPHGLELLDLSYNELTTLGQLFHEINHFKSFFPSARSKVANLTAVYLEGNAWFCDCQLWPLVSWMLIFSSVIEDHPRCQKPPSLQQKPLALVEMKELAHMCAMCSHMCECSCDDAYTSIDCSNRRIHSIPENYMTDLMRMRNQSQAELNTFNLENSEVTRVDERIFSVGFRRIRLSGNRLTSINVNSIDMTNLQSLTLSGNPWTCSCKTTRFYNWLRIHNYTVRDVEDLRCGSGSSSNQVLVKLNFEEFCSIPVLDSSEYPKTIAGITCIALLILTVLWLILWCRRRSRQSTNNFATNQELEDVDVRVISN